MIDETRLREMRARAEAASGDTWRLDQQDGHPVVRVEAGGRPTGVLRLMRDLDPAGLADVDFVAHARTDLDRLITALTGGPDLPAATRAEIDARVTAASPAPWRPFLSDDGGVGGSNVIWVERRGRPAGPLPVAGREPRAERGLRVRRVRPGRHPGPAGGAPSA